MISKDKHQKHPKLVRSNVSKYHRCEWAIYGTTCSNIKLFYQNIVAHLNNRKLLYVDADHSGVKKSTHFHVGKKQFSVDSLQLWNEFDDRLIPIQADAAFINGNHYQASKQIVIIDPNKRESLKKRLNQLNDISMIIVTNGEEDIFDFIKAKTTDGTVVYRSSEISKISDYFGSQIDKTIPELKGVILAGGKSQRMGIDKSQIAYHNGISQEKHLNDLFSKINVKCYSSKRYDYDPQVNSELIIKDRFIDLGPFGAITSAMMHDPNAAWLVVACDLPMLDEALIQRLIRARDTSKFATAFRGAQNPFPEPLITIYEPRAYARFLSFLSLGYACPRKVLINSDIKEVVLENMSSIMNVNTPDEMKIAKLNINNG